MSFDEFPKTHGEIAALLEACEFPAELAERLAAQGRPAVALTTAAASEDACAMGESRFGGRPDLPIGMAWPRRPAFDDTAGVAHHHLFKIENLRAQMARVKKRWFTDEQGELYIRDHQARVDAIGRSFPLSFFCQLDLAELSAETGFDPALPTTGRLLAFFDHFSEPSSFHPEIGKSGCLLWDQTPIEALHRAPAPPEFIDAEPPPPMPFVFPTSTVTASSIMTPIDTGAAGFEAFALDDAERCAYSEALEQIGCFYPQGGDHRIGGWPVSIQSGMQREAQLTSNGIWCGKGECYKTEAARALLPHASDWRLILQIDSDPDLFPAGTGCIYVLMRSQDLTARAFDRAVTIQQFS